MRGHQEWQVFDHMAAEPRGLHAKYRRSDIPVDVASVSSTQQRFLQVTSQRMNSIGHTPEAKQ
jgi:hypothetical protein